MSTDRQRPEGPLPQRVTVLVSHRRLAFRCRFMSELSISGLVLYQCDGMPCHRCMGTDLTTLSLINCNVAELDVPDSVRVLHLSGLPVNCRVRGAMPNLRVLSVDGPVLLPDVRSWPNLMFYQGPRRQVPFPPSVIWFHPQSGPTSHGDGPTIDVQ